jgi:hypothetical protein
VCPEVHPLSSRSQHRQECEGSGDGSPGAAAAGPAPPAANQTHASENSHRAEDRRGGSDRDVRATANAGIEKIPTGAGCQHQGAAQALAPAAAHRRQEEGTGDAIGHGVGEIGVQGERGDAAPDLPEKDPCRIGAASFEPDHFVAPGTGHPEERQQPYRDPDPRGQLAGDHGLGGGKLRAAILARIGGEDLRRPLLLMSGDAQDETTPLAHHCRGETLGDQYQGPLVGEPAAGCGLRRAFLASLHFSPVRYCGRQEHRIFATFSLRPPRRTAQYAFGPLRSEGRESAALSAPSLRDPVRNAG